MKLFRVTVLECGCVQREGRGRAGELLWLTGDTCSECMTWVAEQTAKALTVDELQFTLDIPLTLKRIEANESQS